jgi:hypothetical protein
MQPEINRCKKAVDVELGGGIDREEQAKYKTACVWKMTHSNFFKSAKIYFLNNYKSHNEKFE